MPDVRSILPPDQLPPGFTPIINPSDANPRPLRHEDNINAQIQLCMFRRSLGLPWAEAMLTLRDLCIGLEDQAFLAAWDAWPCHAIKQGDHIIYQPTSEDAAVGFQLILSLLSRYGMTFQRRTTSHTPSLPSRPPPPSHQGLPPDAGDNDHLEASEVAP